MKIFAMPLVCFLLGFTLTACNDQDEIKAQGETQNLELDYVILTSHLNTSLQPSETWSEEKLVEYETKLNRLESLLILLKKTESKDQIAIQGFDNQTFIAVMRNKMISIRELQAMGDGVTLPEDGTAFESQAEIHTTVLKLRLELDRLQNRMENSGEPSLDWSVHELRQFLSLVQTARTVVVSLIHNIRQLEMYAPEKVKNLKSLRDLDDQYKQRAADLTEAIDIKLSQRP